MQHMTLNTLHSNISVLFITDSALTYLIIFCKSRLVLLKETEPKEGIM